MVVPRDGMKSQEVYDFVKEKVLGGEFTPGQKLSEAKIAGMLNVSRVPVREAMFRLQFEGLLVDGGTFCSKQVRYLEECSPEDVLHHYQVREVIQGLGARLAAMSMTGRQIAHLRFLETQRENAWDGAGVETRNQLGAQFHHYIMSHCGNPLLFQIWQSYRLKPFTVSTPDFEARIWADYPDSIRRFEFQPIVDAIAAHDPDEAEQCMREFVRLVTRSIMSVLESSVVGDSVRQSGSQLEAIPAKPFGPEAEIQEIFLQPAELEPKL